MNKIIPALPCSNAALLIEFYKCLGFELVGQFIRSYIILKYNDIEFHFYGTKQVPPENNSSMCIIQTNDLEQLYNAFTTGLKTSTGKIPRSGFPKITKIRELSDDRRFTLTDPSGNTFYVLTPRQTGNDNFFRDLSNQDYAEQYAVLYDLVYSKEDYKVANNMLSKLLNIKDKLNDIDKAKLLLTAIEIQMGIGLDYDKTEIEMLLNKNKVTGDWENIKNRLVDILTC